MPTTKTKPRVTSFAPQFLVDDLTRSITYYQKLGFTFGEPWDGFYAIGRVDGLELHLKEAPKDDDERRQRRANEHLDAAAGVEGIEAFFARCTANGATIIKPLTATPWGTKDLYVEDSDGYIICFGVARPRTESRAVAPHNTDAPSGGAWADGTIGHHGPESAQKREVLPSAVTPSRTNGICYSGPG